MDKIYYFIYRAHCNIAIYRPFGFYVSIFPIHTYWICINYYRISKNHYGNSWQLLFSHSFYLYLSHSLSLSLLLSPRSIFCFHPLTRRFPVAQSASYKLRKRFLCKLPNSHSHHMHTLMQNAKIRTRRFAKCYMIWANVIPLRVCRI